MDRQNGSPSPLLIEIDSIMKKSQTRFGNLTGEPEFIISVAETQNVLDSILERVNGSPLGGLLLEFVILMYVILGYEGTVDLLC
jgi:hypothetical protein